MGLSPVFAWIVDTLIRMKDNGNTNLAAITSDVTDMDGAHHSISICQCDVLAHAASNVESLHTGWNIQLDFTFIVIQEQFSLIWQGWQRPSTSG
jgi:hypothetical protein